MSRPSVHAPFAISLFATLGSTAAAATLEERLLEQGERLVPDQLVDRSANRLWTLRVDSSVDVDAVGAAGAAIDWAWPEAGVMVVRGPDADLGELLRAVPGVRAVEPATRSEPVPNMGPAYAASVDTSWP